MRITILQRGALKDPTITALAQTYVTRFQRFGKLSITESKRPQWPNGHIRILCDERGTQYTSLTFAQQLAKWSMTHGGICLAIGDADGHDPAFAAEADAQFALSAMVFPHRLAHLLIAEQVYRAGCILAGHPYHHA